ncbi:flagellar basal body P-ring protein FlgI [Hahella aquimaris]|uniref:flagellar basal body P-ring protein FlgI n=1 Tax=Hahella sp. HNIBRBA332 TaxID=3015983 RepID=UPI00273C638E|nr:flagellar basal body P-ring protein FlgI [Hahella sp. HNIBRBA332]WLQ15700.1 flagellar basal body P-ring protein FlgI [Hahella sp. HNIBRBA332]
MSLFIRRLYWSLALICFVVAQTASASSVRLKELARIEGVRENSLFGYGLVVGLAGTGDTHRSKATLQSIANTLQQFGISLNSDEIASRNVAAVTLTAKLPPFANSGDMIDVNVSSMGDARSLVGGTLLLAPLKAVNGKIYAVAQGQVSVGGFSYDLNGNVVQKNHPTVGVIPSGASVERGLSTDLVGEDGYINVILNQPDFTTASRIKNAINKTLGSGKARAVHAGKVSVLAPVGEYDLVDYLTRIENAVIEPDRVATVVVNERTGTVVAGGDVTIDNVTISHGNIKVVISTDYQVSQPIFVRETGRGVSTVVTPDTSIDVEESVAEPVRLSSGASIADLVTALRQIKTSTRDVITILQLIKTAGALHAQLVIQ